MLIIVHSDDNEWRAQGLWAIDTLNPTSFRGSQSFRAKTSADIIVLQETKALPCDSQSLRSGAAQNNWRIEMNAARPGKHGSRSGGTAVLAKKCFGLEKTDALEIPSEPHRAVFTHTTALGGCTVISLYLRHGEGLSPENKNILEELAAALSLIEGRWIVASDVNMPPDVLASSGWPDMVQGVISHCGRPTSSANNIDYFITDKATADCIHAVQLVDDAGVFPHAAVRLLIRANEPRRLRRCLAKSPHVPAIFPDGPHTEALQQVLSGERQGLTEEERTALTDTPASWSRRIGWRTRAIVERIRTKNLSEVDALCHKWTTTSRNVFSALLGRDVGTSDEARFAWRPIDDRRRKNGLVSSSGQMEIRRQPRHQT